MLNNYNTNHSTAIALNIFHNVYLDIDKKMRERKDRTETLSALRRNPENCSLRKVSDDIAKIRRLRKNENRRKDKRKLYTAQDWAAPAPANLVAKLEIPKCKSKYQSYFEFADNPDKKEKRLEFKVTNNIGPPPGYVFVPIGDPTLSNACKELSREMGAMIFIVSTCKNDHSKVSEHVHRVGFHFKETVLNAVLRTLGERKLHHSSSKVLIEPIPETQEEINKQADAAIRDLFPKIPNTDRQLVIEHAFKKGALFQGEPTVGTQSNIPLSRRVQLAVLAHIRHTHTRYDKLLRETSWLNARKVVEPVCLDIILKWRGNEENGRDQMDEILREVVIITDSESDYEDDQTDSKDSSDEEHAVISCPPSEINQQSSLRHIPKLLVPACDKELGGRPPENFPGRIQSLNPNRKCNTRKKQARRGFKRYQAAWEQALSRQQAPLNPANLGPTPENLSQNRDYLHNERPYLGFSNYESSQLKSVYQSPHYHTDFRQQKIDINRMPLLRSRSFHHDNYSEVPICRSENIDSYRSHVPIYNPNSSHRTDPVICSGQRHISPLAISRHCLQKVSVESIETASNDYLLPRIEGRVFDRFNYTPYFSPPRSNGLRYHKVESIGVASNNASSSHVEERVSDRFNYTQNSHSQWSNNLRHQDIGSIEVTSNEVIPSRTERHVSDRFNYTRYPQSMWSDEFRQNIVESIETASHEIMQPHIEKRVPNRLSYTQNKCPQRSDGSRNHELERHQVIIIDDEDNHRVGDHCMARYPGSNSSRRYPQDINFYSDQSTVNHPTKNFSVQPRDFKSRKLMDSLRLDQIPSTNSRPIFPDPAFVEEPPKSSSHSAMRLASQASYFEREKVKTIPKSQKEIVDLTLQGSSPIIDEYPYRQANEYFHSKSFSGY
ncbi:hypothetical protein HI914_01384 [Erysiphe necator]|nr:hypothetical protein HI914_01384 [Erysiphe necator]